VDTSIGYPPAIPSRPPAQAPPPAVGLTWGGYVEAYRDEFGGWTALARELQLRAGQTTAIPNDVSKIETALQTLAARGQQPGGQYGEWMLEFFGLPTAVQRWVIWMGQSHSRFADLPEALRVEQLLLWNRPPVSESAAAAWVNVGLASALFRLGDLTRCGQHLAQASRGSARAGPFAAMEVGLLAAELAAAAGDLEQAEHLLGQVGIVHNETPPDPDNQSDRVAYHARLMGQRAEHLIYPRDREPTGEELARAQTLLGSIPGDTSLPYAQLRRCNGLAHCAAKLGDVAAGATLARQAVVHAGDAGLVRLRIAALRGLSAMVDEPESTEIRDRVAHLTRMLQDEDPVPPVAPAD
jgi:hypothetical protein